MWPFFHVASLFSSSFALYVLEFGRKTASDMLFGLYRGIQRPFSDEACRYIVRNEKEGFCNWVIVTLNLTTRASSRHCMFQWTVVAHHRGLSRSGREFLASKGLLLKRTTYQSMIDEKLAMLYLQIG